MASAKARTKSGAKTTARKQPSAKASSVKKAAAKPAAKAKAATGSRKAGLKKPAAKAKREKRQKPWVVNLRYTDQYDVYVGRANGRYGLRQSKFANPFKGPNSLIEFAEYFLDNEGLQLQALQELRGKTLACWCRPPEGFKGIYMCPAQLLAAYCNDIDFEDIECPGSEMPDLGKVRGWLLSRLLISWAYGQDTSERIR